MSARAPRFEVVRSDAGWFARFRAANGRKVWQTEVYRKRVRAEQAIALIIGEAIVRGSDGVPTAFVGSQPTEVREVDERTGATS